MTTIVYHYDETKNPQGDVLDRVPLRDVTAEAWADMPADLRNAVAACPFYTKVPKGKKSADTGGNSE